MIPCRSERCQSPLSSGRTEMCCWLFYLFKSETTDESERIEPEPWIYPKR
jgi:hypothetical protein